MTDGQISFTGRLWKTKAGFGFRPAEASEIPMTMTISGDLRADDVVDSSLADKEHLVLFFDAGTRVSNPGPSAIAIYSDLGADEHFNYHLRITELVGERTNNEAEWMALIRALHLAMRAPALKRLEIFSDSKLVVKQARGEWRVRGNLREFHQLAIRMAQELVDHGCLVTIAHVPRAQNAEADRLVTECLDAHLGRKRGY